MISDTIKIPFKVSARAGKLLVREIFSNPEGAITELVKNSYDADAENCLVIFDIPLLEKEDESCIISSDENLLFYNGQAIIGESEIELQVLKKILESKLFWYYVKSTSKPYSSDYYSLNGNYINNFGVYQFTAEQKDHLLNLIKQEEIDSYLCELYEIDIP